MANDKTFKVVVEVDLAYPMKHADSDEVKDFSQGQWQTYTTNLILAKLQEVEEELGVDIFTTDEDGEQLVDTTVD